MFDDFYIIKEGIIVLYCFHGAIITAQHCDLLKIYCAPPNLGITRK